MPDPHELGGVSVTLKQDDPKAGMWIVFHGTPSRVAANLVEASGLEDTEGMTLFGIANEANKLYKATTTVGRVLGGRELGRNSDAWNAAASAPATPAVPEKNPLYDTIESIADIAGLQRLWAENRAAFDGDAELFAAWKARGKTISEESK